MKLPVLLLALSSVFGQSVTAPATSATGGASGTVTVSTSSPVTVASAGYYYNNASGALTYNLPAIGSANIGYEWCFRQAPGKSGALTLQAPGSTFVDLYGTNSASAGALISTGALGDAACLVAVSTTQYVASIIRGAWTHSAGANLSLVVGTPTTDANGVKSYVMTSHYMGPASSTTRVLEPTNPTAGAPHRLVYVLPVETGVTTTSSTYSDGLEELRLLNAHNVYNLTLIAPSFSIMPWYGNHATDAGRQMESFIVSHLVPWGDTFAAVDTPRWVLGFSKSGFGALTLILRNQATFDQAIAWDAPAQLSDITNFQMADTYGTEAQFDSYYHIPTLVTANAASFTTNRIWVSGDTSTYTTDMAQLRSQLTTAAIPHTWVAGVTRAHSWTSGWLAGAMASAGGVAEDEPTPPAVITSSFTGTENPLSENSTWATPTGWGAVQKNSGAIYTVADCAARLVTAIGADQYAEIVYAEAGIGSGWLGATTRGQAGAAAGYIAVAVSGAIKLYRIDGGGSPSFVELGAVVTTLTTAPRRIRLESVGSAHRVYFNDVLLISVTSATYTTGQPGIIVSNGGPTIQTFEGGSYGLTVDLPPTRSAGAPSGTLATAATTYAITLTTSEAATAKWSATAGVAYASMANTFGTTGSTSHSDTVSIATGTNTFYVKTIDAAGNANSDDYIISFVKVVPSTRTETVASTFTGTENPLSESGLWDSPGTWSDLRKATGAHTVGLNSGGRVTTPATAANQYAGITYDADPGSASWVGVMTRMQSGNGGCYLAIAYAGEVRLYRADDSGGLAFTQLAAATATLSTAPRTLFLESVGNLHKVYFNGAQLISYTSTAVYTTGQPGMSASLWSGGPTVKITAFSSGTL